MSYEQNRKKYEGDFAKAIDKFNSAVDELKRVYELRIREAYEDAQYDDTEYERLKRDYDNLNKRVSLRDVLASISSPLASIYNVVYGMPDDSYSAQLREWLKALEASFNNSGVQIKYHGNGEVKPADCYSDGVELTPDAKKAERIYKCSNIGFEAKGERLVDERVVVYKYDPRAKVAAHDAGARDWKKPTAADSFEGVGLHGNTVGNNAPRTNEQSDAKYIDKLFVENKDYEIRTGNEGSDYVVPLSKEMQDYFYELFSHTRAMPLRAHFEHAKRHSIYYGPSQHVIWFIYYYLTLLDNRSLAIAVSDDADYNSKTCVVIGQSKQR